MVCKGLNDYVIEIDKVVEVVIIEVIKKFYFDYVIVVEELGIVEGKDNSV